MLHQPLYHRLCRRYQNRIIEPFRRVVSQEREPLNLVKVQIVEEHEANTVLLRHSKLDTNTTGVKEQDAIDKKSTTLLANRLIRCIHEAIFPVAPQYVNPRIGDDCELACGQLPENQVALGRIFHHLTFYPSYDKLS